MRTLVTGGAGFIGSHVVAALVERGEDVTVLDDFSTGHPENLDRVSPAVRSRVTVCKVDIAAPAAVALVRQARPDVMLLIAGQPSVQASMRDPLLDAQANVIGLVNMLEAARAARCSRVVFASSGGTIFGEAGPGPSAEDDPRRPVSCYGVTKSIASDYLRVYAHQYGLVSVALALGNVYGPGQAAGVIATFAAQVIADRPCTINGDGCATRDFVHVNDVVAAFLAAISRGSGLINIGSGVGTSVLRVHELLAGLVSTARAPVHAPASPGEVRHVRLDISRANEELGWRPSIDLVEGIGTVLHWLRRPP